MKTKSDAVGEIGHLVGALSEKFDADVDAERDYLAQRCPRLVGPTQDLSTLAIHLLAHIADGAPNIVGLAARSGQLKGTVSKQVQRLVDAGLVERSPVPGNRKEIRLSLSDDGRELARVHRQMHDEMDEGIREFLMRYTSAELATVTKILTALLHTERRGVRLETVTGRRR